jgi:tetratricopeptide (TPR) repeat protein
MPTRSRFRHRLIRWLGGEPRHQVGHDALAPVSDEGDEGGQLVLPAPDTARQSVLAGRYYAHAEELIRRGAAELAAPFFRQAYVLLRASQQGGGIDSAEAAAGADGVIPSPVIDLQPEAPRPDVTPPSPSAAMSVDLEATIQNLKAGLTAETAEAVGRAAQGLVEQGNRHPELDHLLGLVHILRGQSSAAAQHFRMAISQAPGHYRSLVNLAGLLLSEGRLEEAQALLHKALEQVNPESEPAVPALTNLSLVHQAAGRSMEEALLVLRIHRIKPGHLRSARLLQAAGVLQEMAEEPAAIELLQWLSEHEGGQAVWHPLAALLERRGDYQAAAQVYRLLLQPREPAESAVIR